MMNKEKIVLLHGWGFNRFIWDPILPQLQADFEPIALDLPPYELPQMLEWLSQNTPQQAIYLGWSLGGLIAMAMCAAFPQRVKKLISVAASPRFLKTENWPGIEEEKLDQFAAQFYKNPTEWSQKFISSQLGSLDCKELNLSQFLNSPPPDIKTLESGLRILKNTDLRASLHDVPQKKLFLFGRLDRITLEKTSAALEKIAIPNLTCQSIKKAAHIPFLSHPDIFLEAIREFCLSLDSDRKVRIRKSFNQAASSYHEEAQLQAQCAEKLLAQIPEDLQPKSILELGCGTGHLTQKLIARFPGAQIVAIDIAEKMLEKTQIMIKSGLICADAEALPFAEKSFDLIISNFTLQWCELSATFQECQRVLQTSGHFYFCTLGENTLKELKSCWLRLDYTAHVNEFPSPSQVLNQLNAQQFSKSCVLEENTQEFHDHPLRIISRIKAWGAHNIHPSRAKGLCGKNKFKQLIQLYQENYTQAEGVYASYHTLYGSARKN